MILVSRKGKPRKEEQTTRERLATEFAARTPEELTRAGEILNHMRPTGLVRNARGALNDVLSQQTRDEEA